MQEFDTVSAPANDPAALVAALNARSGLGWNVVTIVANGGDLTAFVSRESSGSPSAASSSVSVEPTPAVAPAPAPVAEPSGWAVAPAAQVAPQPTPQPAASYQAAPAASTGVPANWYADPSGRYELRYWDGNQWTEHVSRGGQQFTDAPVA